MTQSPKELVQAAIRFTSPERLPVKMESLGVNDTACILRKAHETRDEYGLVVDEWGCRWEHSETWNMGQVEGHPLSSLTEYETVPVPDYSQNWLYEDCYTAFDFMMTRVLEGINNAVKIASGGEIILELDGTIYSTGNLFEIE